MTTQQTKVDWDRPIEAVHEDGRVVAIVDNGPSCVPGERQVRPFLDTYHHVFMADGRSVSPVSGWRIRNVAQPEVNGNSRTPTPSPELTARMVAFVREVADEGSPCSAGEVLSWIDTARALAAELEPVDEHEAYADALLKQQGWHGEPSIGFAAVARMIATAHEDGRALAEAGK